MTGSVLAELGPAYRVEAWSDLFVGVAGASAALAGLVFVAVSINIDRILKFDGLPARALATVMLLLSLVIVSVFGLAPGQSTTAFGIELVASGLLFTGVIGTFYLRSAPQATGHPAGVALNMALIALATVPVVVAGVSLLAEAGGGLYWVLAATVAALFAAVVNAWVLLVEILR